MGQLMRNQDIDLEIVEDIEEEEEDRREGSPEDARRPQPGGPSTIRRRVIKFTESNGDKTLEPAEKLNQKKVDTLHMFDPLFK